MKRQAYLAVLTVISVLTFGACSAEGNASAGAFGDMDMAGSNGEIGNETGREGAGDSGTAAGQSASGTGVTGGAAGQSASGTGETGGVTGQSASGTGVTGGAAGQDPYASGNMESSSAKTLQDDSIPDAYRKILDGVYKAILGKETGDAAASELTGSGVSEALMGRTTEEALAHIGYVLYDVDGNGIQELIIADTGDGLWNNRILNMYTVHDNASAMIIDGGERDRYYILNDGRIYNEGSNGAAYSVFGTYRMGADGLEPIDYYFSDYLNDTAEAISWFHNTTGEGDVKESEIMELENDDVPWKMQEEFEAQVMPLDLTFFSAYNIASGF